MRQWRRRRCGRCAPTRCLLRLRLAVEYCLVRFKNHEKVDDAENVNVCFEEKKITFSCDQVEITAEGKRGAKKQFRNELDLFGRVDVEVDFFNRFNKLTLIK